MSNKPGLDKLIKFQTETTNRAKALAVIERMKASKTISEKTRNTYEKTGARRIDFERDDLGPLMEDVTARSWHATKSGLLYTAGRLYQVFRKEADEFRKSGDLNGASEAAVKARKAVMAFERVTNAVRPEIKKRRITKRNTLPKNDDWQQVAFDAATPAQKLGVAVMWASGCRPSEIETGVAVDMIEHKGKSLIRVMIPGAKVTETSGQPQRVVYVDPDSDAGRAVILSMDGNEKVSLQRKAKRLSADLDDIQKKTNLKISPYSFRHQLSANLKAEKGDDVEAVAKVMGHLTTRSQGRYGLARQAQSGRTGILGANATRPVKETRQSPPSPKGQESKPQPGD